MTQLCPPFAGVFRAIEPVAEQFEFGRRRPQRVFPWARGAAVPQITAAAIAGLCTHLRSGRIRICHLAPTISRAGDQLNYWLTGPSRWHRHCSENIVSSRRFLWKIFHALRVNTHARPRLTLRLANTMRHCADRYLPPDVYTFTTTTVW